MDQKMHIQMFKITVFWDVMTCCLQLQYTRVSQTWKRMVMIKGMIKGKGGLGETKQS
jgi:hypothetical protein